MVQSSSTSSKACAANSSAHISSLIGKLEQHMRLSAQERRLLRSLEGLEHSLRRGEVLWKEGAAADSLYVVKLGWMVGQTLLPDGRQQVVDIYCPGDVLGLRDIVFDHSGSSVTAVTAAILAPFPKEAMDELFVSSPRLAALLYSLGMLENITVIDRLRTVAGLDARQRLCHFLLQVRTRLRFANDRIDNRFTLPLTQEIIGNALGLSKVHLNRTLRQLEVDSLIERNGKEIWIKDIERLQKASSYEDRNYRIDTNWFPTQ